MKISSITIPRNSEIASATIEQIINSPQLEKTLKPFEVRAGPSQNINSSPVGSLCLTEAGIAFLTSGSKKFTSNTDWTGIIGASFGGLIGTLVAHSIASSFKQEKKLGELIRVPTLGKIHPKIA